MKSTEPITSKSDLLTLPEAASKLGVTEKTVRRLVRRGKLRVVRFSKTAPLKFRQVDVAACIEKHLTPDPAAVLGALSDRGGRQ